MDKVISAILKKYNPSITLTRKSVFIFAKLSDGRYVGIPEKAYDYQVFAILYKRFYVVYWGKNNSWHRQPYYWTDIDLEDDNDYDFADITKEDFYKQLLVSKEIEKIIND